METNQLYLYQLNFSTPLHIGNEREDYASGSAMVHSDTLYAAIFFAWNNLGKKEWIPKFENGEIGFTISSLFPYYNDVYFLPRPMYSPDIKLKDIEETSIRKSIKKTAWVDTTIFESLVNDTEVSHCSKHNFCDNFWSSTILPEESFLSSQVMPRSSISRIPGEDTKIFYIERFYFKENAGLYFLANFNSSEDKDKFEAALRYLGDEGIGTDRNVGHGKFSFSERAPFTLKCNRNHGMALNLGLFCPEPDNKEGFLKMLLQHKSIGYDLLKRGGWLSEPYQTWRKKSVYMFKEGSVLHFDSPYKYFIAGKNINVNPESVPIDHPVWRCGRTIFLSF
jgi:CRISPR type III-A-associated RAMP protein Csm4